MNTVELGVQIKPSFTGGAFGRSFIFKTIVDFSFGTRPSDEIISPGRVVKGVLNITGEIKGMTRENAEVVGITQGRIRKILRVAFITGQVTIQVAIGDFRKCQTFVILKEGPVLACFTFSRRLIHLTIANRRVSNRSAFGSINIVTIHTSRTRHRGIRIDFAIGDNLLIRDSHTGSCRNIQNVTIFAEETDFGLVGHGTHQTIGDFIFNASISGFVH
jgi:hypothetical protein